MPYWKDILNKKPWLYEYYYPSTGSRYTILLYINETPSKNKKDVD